MTSLVISAVKELADHRRFTLATNIDGIPMACCDNTFRSEATCRCTRRRSSTAWLGSSMNGRVRLWASKPQPMLHRSLELAGQSGHCATVVQSPLSGGKTDIDHLLFFIVSDVTRQRRRCWSERSDPLTRRSSRLGRLRAATNPKKKRRPAEANRHLPVNSRPLIELLTIGGHERQQ
jgi:hypothetical protein